VKFLGANVATRVERVEVKNLEGAPGGAIALDLGAGDTDVLALACRFMNDGASGNHSDGVYVGGTGVRVQGCYVNGVGDTGIVAENAVGAQITGNTVASATQGIGLSNFTGGEVTGNDISSTTYAGIGAEFALPTAATQRAKRAAIVGNTIHDCTTGKGIFIYNRAQDVTVSGNPISNSPVPPALDNAIFADDSYNLNFSGNTIANNGGYGLTILGVQGFSVVGNFIVNNSLAASGSYPGILLAQSNATYSVTCTGGSGVETCSYTGTGNFDFQTDDVVQNVGATGGSGTSPAGIWTITGVTATPYTNTCANTGSVCNFTLNLPGTTSSNVTTTAAKVPNQGMIAGNKSGSSGQATPSQNYGMYVAGGPTAIKIFPGNDFTGNLTGGILQTSNGVDSAFLSAIVSTSIVFDASVAKTQEFTLTGSVTFTLKSYSTIAGDQINVIICQDAAGNHTITWPSNVKGAMTIGSTASKCSAQSFVFDGTNAYALSAGVTNL